MSKKSFKVSWRMPRISSLLSGILIFLRFKAKPMYAQESSVVDPADLQENDNSNNHVVIAEKNAQQAKHDDNLPDFVKPTCYQGNELDEKGVGDSGASEQLVRFREKSFDGKEKELNKKHSDNSSAARSVNCQETEQGVNAVGDTNKSPPRTIHLNPAPFKDHGIFFQEQEQKVDSKEMQKNKPNGDNLYEEWKKMGISSSAETDKIAKVISDNSRLYYNSQIIDIEILKNDEKRQKDRSCLINIKQAITNWLNSKTFVDNACTPLHSRNTESFFKAIVGTINDWRSNHEKNKINAYQAKIVARLNYLDNAAETSTCNDTSVLSPSGIMQVLLVFPFLNLDAFFNADIFASFSDFGRILWG